jgi:hypothetical protein
VSGATALLEVCAEESAVNTNKKKTERERKTKTLLRASIGLKNGRLGGIDGIGLREQPLRCSGIA